MTELSKDIPAILANPASYGFEFNLETVERDGIKYENIPVMKVTEVAKFEAAFPGTLLKTSNSQSMKVNSQRVGRDAAAKGVKDPQAIRTKNVQWLLGIRVASVPKVYVGPNDETFATKEEAQAAWMEFAAK